MIYHSISYGEKCCYIVLGGEPCVDSMLWWRAEKEKDSIYIQRIMRENFDASLLATLSHLLLDM